MPIVPLKLCIKCRVEKPGDAFGKDKRRPDGLFPYCKACRQKDPVKRSEWEQNRAAGLKKCSTCKQWLLVSFFGQNRSMNNGIHSHCRECTLGQVKRYATANIAKVRARRKSYAAAYPEKQAALWKSYYAANSHRLIMKANAQRREYDTSLDTLTGTEWKDIVVAQGGSCAKCKRLFNSKFVPNRDHIVPFSSGGYLTRGNTQALCRPCNASKGTKTIRY